MGSYTGKYQGLSGRGRNVGKKESMLVSERRPGLGRVCRLRRACLNNFRRLWAWRLPRVVWPGVIRAGGGPHSVGAHES